MSFSRSAVEELSSLHGEPDWFRDRRLEAFDLYERLGLPDTKTDEEWRKVDLRGLNLEAFQAFLSPDGSAPTEPVEGVAGVIKQRGPFPGLAQLAEEVVRQGVIFCPLPQAVREHRELVERHLFAATRPERDKFSALHSALLTGGTFLYVPDGVVIERPLVSQFWAGQGGGTVLPHTLILAGKRSGFNYLDEFIGQADGDASLTSGSAEVFADDGANLGYVAVQRWGGKDWQFANQRVHLRRDAHALVVNVGLGGGFAKLRAETILEGPGASAELKGLFFGTSHQFFDFHTLQSHAAPNTASDLLFKGALRDSARSVYVGLVVVEKNARGTEANQANRNLLLSEKAKATSEPILEIKNNDIRRCSHGATVGPVDPEQMFYLQSRGIPRPVAQRMIVQGFLGEILDRIPIPRARELVEGELAARIG